MNFGNDAKNGILTVGSTIESNLNMVGDKITSGVTQIGNDIKNGVLDAGKTIVDNFNSVGDAINTNLKGFGTSLWGGLSSFGDKITNSFLDVKNSFVDVGNQIKDSTLTATNYLKNELGPLLKDQLEPLAGGLSTMLTDLLTGLFAAQQKQIVIPQSSSLDMGAILPIVLLAGGGIFLMKK